MKPKYIEWIGKWYFPTKKGEWRSIFVLDAHPVSPGSQYFDILAIDASAMRGHVRLGRRSFQLYYEKIERVTDLNKNLIQTIFRRDYEFARGHD